MANSENQETRTIFRDLLKLISDAEDQRQYEREVPIANVPAELVCMWFNDHYHPDASWFSECFSARERKILADFNAFYQQRADSLPTSGGVAKLHASENWAEIMDKAHTTLAELGWVT